MRLHVKYSRNREEEEEGEEEEEEEEEGGMFRSRRRCRKNGRLDVCSRPPTVVGTAA